MSEATFVIGLPARADAAATTRARAQSESTGGFTPADLIARIEQAFGARSPETGAGAEEPRHFAPADPGSDPTAGWDMLDPAAQPPACLEQVEAARAEGYEEGFAAAAHAAQAEATRDRALLDGVAAQLRGGGAIDRAALAEALRRTVLTLVTALVGETGVSGPLLAARVEGAVDLLADASESAMLRVNPDDLSLLAGLLPGTIFPVGDAQVARGSFVLEAASTIVEDGPALWMEQLTAAIERAAVPAC
ncbi:flagellar assembly protein FliH [Sphingomonas sp. RHCKR7]|uniref:FliH/SctL family protein n=1 Tax=Sphingomonas folli TaxID=2862497 RepID=UPI001CA545B7|nr:flagellar assembly protein FliH [Sphingomonas folli]MBW6528450.1 flagellar assembly protein FliH [Sphingomonas folli]